MFSIPIAGGYPEEHSKTVRTLGGFISGLQSLYFGKDNVFGSYLTEHILLQSFLGEESIVNDPRDAFHFFSWKEPGPFLVHCKKLVLDLPPKKFLRLAAFDHEYVAGVRRSGGMVNVWGFNDALENENCPENTSSLWTRDLGNRNTVTITAVEFSYPLLLVGKSSGCCELWDVSSNSRVANLQHGTVGSSGLLAISRILLLSSNILTRTHTGR